MALPRVEPETADDGDEMVTAGAVARDRAAGHDRAVFLDRDGVLNANVERDGRAVAPVRLEDFRLLPGVGDAVRRLKAAGFQVVVVTNQPDIGTGRTAREIVDAMHTELRRHVPVDDIRICTHVDADGCGCRKPRPGMLLEAAAERGIVLGRSYMVGDRWRDVGAGNTAGCTTILVGAGDGTGPGGHRPAATVPALPEAVDLILRRERIGVTS